MIIEEGVQIFPYSTIQGPTYIGKDSIVGNFGFIRGYCFLSKNVLVGDHSCCFRSVCGKDTRISHFCHFTYSLLGFNSTTSAYVITTVVRADRKKISVGNDLLLKIGAIIGCGTHIAPFCVISPNIHIGNNCFIGSHSVINENIESNTFLTIEQNQSKRKNQITIPKRGKLN